MGHSYSFLVFPPLVCLSPSRGGANRLQFGWVAASPGGEVYNSLYLRLRWVDDLASDIGFVP